MSILKHLSPGQTLSRRDFDLSLADIFTFLDLSFLDRIGFYYRHLLNSSSAGLLIHNDTSLALALSDFPLVLISFSTGVLVRYFLGKER